MQRVQVSAWPHACIHRLRSSAGVVLAVSVLIPRLAAADDLLPDVTVDANVLAQQRVETSGGSKRLWFSTATPNLGPGTLEVRAGTLDSTTLQAPVVQRIYRSDGSFWDRPAGALANDPEHGHMHFEGWAVYRLRAIGPDASPGAVLVESYKTSFCLFDLTVLDLSNPFLEGSKYSTCGVEVQGISAGWADVYDLNVPGQVLDISNVPDGEYWLEAEVDPEHQILELDETNNVARLRIFLGPAPAFEPDAYEPNDTMDDVAMQPLGAPNSSRLGSLSKTLQLDDLTMGVDGVDQFEFQLPHAAIGGMVAIGSPFQESDLDLAVFDSTGAAVGWSTGASNYEQISLAGLPAGGYAIRVVGYDLDNPGYWLRVDPGLNEPPEIQLLSPANKIWVERAFENPELHWTVLDAEHDETHVSLELARARMLDKSAIAPAAYQRVDGATGGVNLNSEGLDLGEWFVHASISDAGGMSEAWAPGSLVIYLKGDVDFSGTVDGSDLAVACRALERGQLETGWNVILDMNRDGKVDASDQQALRRLVVPRSNPRCVTCSQAQPQLGRRRELQSAGPVGCGSRTPFCSGTARTRPDR